MLKIFTNLDELALGVNVGCSVRVKSNLYQDNFINQLQPIEKKKNKLSNNAHISFKLPYKYKKNITL